MMRFRGMGKVIVAFALLLTTAGTALASLVDTMRNLDEFVRLWEEQAGKGNKPSASDCEYMRAQLAQAQAELAAERARWNQANQAGPGANASPAAVQAWTNYMRNWQRELNAAERKIQDLEKRINELCGPAMPGAQMKKDPPPPPPDNTGNAGDIGGGGQGDGRGR